MNNPHFIPIDLLDPHPDNPRLQENHEVIASIASQLREGGSFPVEHAILVRINGSRFEIISGHHRVKAAKEAGLTEVACWVQEMAPDEAYMQLVLANEHSELTPMEIGRHALKAVTLSKGGRGKKEGISEYARKMSKSDSYIGQLMYGAEVYEYLNLTPDYGDKVQHLKHVHGLDRSLWQVVTSHFHNRNMNVKEVNKLVQDIKGFNISDKWQSIFLPLDAAVQSYLDHKRPSPEELTQIINAAELVESRLPDSQEVERFHGWLRSKGSKAWDPNLIGKYAYAQMEIMVGDFSIAQSIKRHSIALAIAEINTVGSSATIIKDLAKSVSGALTNGGRVFLDLAKNGEQLDRASLLGELICGVTQKGDTVLEMTCKEPSLGAVVLGLERKFCGLVADESTKRQIIAALVGDADQVYDHALADDAVVGSTEPALEVVANSAQGSTQAPTESPLFEPEGDLASNEPISAAPSDIPDDESSPADIEPPPVAHPVPSVSVREKVKGTTSSVDETASKANQQQAPNRKNKETDPLFDF